MPLIRITESRVMEGYAKASFFYEAGETHDTDTLPEGHLARLEAAGVVEHLPPEAGPDKAKPDEAGPDTAAAPAPRKARP